MPQNQNFNEFLLQNPFLIFVFNALVDFINSSTAIFILSLLKAIAFVLGIILLGGIIFLFIKLNVIGNKLTPIKKTLARNPNTLKENSKEFQKIKEMTKRNNLNEDRLALLEASLLLSKVLKGLGYQGNLGEIIPQITLWKTVTPNEILKANDFKTQIVHLQNKDFLHSDVEKALEVYEKALKDLKAI